MKKVFVLLMFGSLLSGNILFAQPVAKGKVTPVVSSPEGNMYMNAEWSPDGSSFAFSGEKFNGIWVSDADGKSIRQVTTDKNSGFGFQWSADGKTILSRPVIVENNRRYHQVKLYDVESGRETLLLEKTRSLKGLPVWTEGFRKVAMKVGDEIKSAETGKSYLKDGSTNVQKTVDFGGGVVSASKEEAQAKVSFPRFDGHYVFNRQVSPDGNKLVFEVSGLGLYVSKADGTDVRHLGRGEHASWMPDNRYVMVTMVEDDGYAITSGNLFAVDTETGEYYPLYTDDKKIALKPSVSPDGSKVLFDNPRDGRIYIMEIE